MLPITDRHWKLRERRPSEDLSALVQATDLPEVFLQLLAGRGLTSAADIDHYLQGGLRHLPDPSLLSDLDKATSRLACAITRKERIAIHGDYDVDGICGTALLVHGLRMLGASVEYHIPHRLTDGYGLSEAALHRTAQNGCTLAVTVDCGITAHSAATRATELGLDLIITDHHQPSDTLPDAFAVVNPHRQGDLFPGKELAGVGVAFMLLIALRRALQRQNDTAVELRDLLDLVALGTVADVAPLTGVNRLLVKAGLDRMNRGPVRTGMSALQKVAQIKTWSAGTIGFQVGPRLNASGRLDNALQAVDLLLTDDMHRALDTAQTLNHLNQQRQKLEQTTLEQAIAMVDGLPDQPALVLAAEEWHPGVIGIVASRLVERYHRPTVLISIDGSMGKGSARSVPGLDLYGALEHAQADLLAFGGHRAAAGLQISTTQIDAFRSGFQQAVDQLWSQHDREPSILYDAELQLEDLEPQLFELISLCSPFGVGNAAPVFMLRNVRARQGQILSQRHLKFRLSVTPDLSLDCIAFKQASVEPLLRNPVDLLVQPEINRWQGRRSLQLQVKAMRAAIL